MFICQLCSPETPKTSFCVELDAAKATWLSHDIVMFSSKNGAMLLLTVVYDGRYDTIASCLYKCSRFMLIDI
jgi:cleavage and polyadenylation specificity factor subunit 1